MKILRELVGIEESDRMISDLTINGKIKKFPASLKRLFFKEMLGSGGIRQESLCFLWRYWYSKHK